MQQGRPAVRDRPAPLPRRARPARRRSSSAHAARRSWRRRRTARAQTLLAAQGDLARGVRHAQAPRTRRATRRARRRGRGRRGEAQPGVHRGARADRRPRRPRAGDRRQPRPGRRDAADHAGVAWTRSTCTSRPTSRRYLRYSAAGAQRRARTRRATRCASALPTRQGFPHEGTVDFVDNQVDPRTGTIRARAVLRQCRPRASRPACLRACSCEGSGEFEAMLIDDKAVLTDQDRKYVYVLGADNKARAQGRRARPHDRRPARGRLGPERRATA